MATTEFGDIDGNTAAYCEFSMLKAARNTRVLGLLAQSKEMPKNKTDSVKFRRVRPLVPSTVPLLEGVTPTAQQLRYEAVTGRLRQYGSLVKLTDQVDDLHELSVLQDASHEVGVQAGDSKELLLYNVMKGGTSVMYANGTSRASVNTVYNKQLQRKLQRFFHSQQAKKITKILAPSVNVGTKPVEAAYVCFCSTDLEHDISELPGFIPVAEYGKRETLSEHELGSCGSVRYIISSALVPFADAGGSATGLGHDVVSTGGTYADVYPMIFVAQDAYADVVLAGGGAFKPKVLKPGIPRDGDELGQRGSVGTKWYACPMILNHAWICRIEVAATDL